MKLKSLLLISTFSLLASSAFADTVDNTAVTTFTNGTPADAGQVNGNFQALIDAINDNAARIAALEASTGNTVSGKTYKLNQIGTMVRGRPSDVLDGPGYAAVTNLSQQFTVTFSSNGSFTLTGTENEGELNAYTGEMEAMASNDPVNLSGTWTQNGSTLSISTGSVFTVSLDGNVIVLNDYIYGLNDGDDEGQNITRSENSLIIGVRTQ